MKHLSSLILVAVSLLAPHRALAQFSPRDFFAMAPASIFYTEDEMSDADKVAVIKDRYKVTQSFSCTAWGVAEETAESLMLRYCRDSFVSIRVYPSPGQEHVVIVQSARSSGRATDLQFFRVDVGSKELFPISFDTLETVGIESVSENDLLTERDKFKDTEAKKASLLLDEDGSLRANVDTWMNPRWETKEISYDVIFEWTGNRFQKRVVPLTVR